MGNLFNGFDEEMTEPKALQMPKEVLIDREQGKSAIDAVYDALIVKMEHYNALIRDAELDIKHWKEMNTELKTLIETIDKRK